MRKDLIVPVVLLCISLYGVYFGLTETMKMPTAQYPELKTDVTLESTRGPINLSEFNGKVSLVFFGYTHCPDVCPATLGNIAATLAEFNDDEIQAIQPIFISLDPERDSAAKADAFAKHFHPKIIGLSGTVEQVEAAKRGFAVGSKKQSPDSKDGKIDANNYTMSHSTYIFIVRPDGQIGHLMGHLDAPSTIATKAKKWLRWAD